MNGFAIALIVISVLSLAEIIYGAAKRSRGLIFIGVLILVVALSTLWLSLTYQNTIAPVAPGYYI